MGVAMGVVSNRKTFRPVGIIMFDLDGSFILPSQTLLFVFADERKLSDTTALALESDYGIPSFQLMERVGYRGKVLWVWGRVCTTYIDPKNRWYQSMIRIPDYETACLHLRTCDQTNDAVRRFLAEQVYWRRFPLARSRAQAS